MWHIFVLETAQAMFVDFKNVLDTSRKQLPLVLAKSAKLFATKLPEFYFPHPRI